MDVSWSEQVSVEFVPVFFWCHFEAEKTAHERIWQEKNEDMHGACPEQMNGVADKDKGHIAHDED